MSRKPQLSRRNVIKALGAGCTLATLGTAAQATAGTSDQDIRTLVDQAYEKAEEVEEKAAKEAQEIRDSDDPNAEERAREHRITEVNKAWENFFKEREVACATTRQQYEFTKEEENTEEISPNSVSDISTTGLDATIGLVTHDYINYYASINFELYFSYRTTGHSCYREEYGEDPLDGGGLRWDSDAWNYDGDTFSERSNTSSNVDYSDDFNSQEAFGFDIDDAGMFSDWADDADCNSSLDNNFTAGYSSREYYGVYLTEDDDTDEYNDDDTWIMGAYDHTWSGTRGTIQVGAGVGATGPSISIGYGSTQTLEHEPTTTEDDGNTPLEIYKDEDT